MPTLCPLPHHHDEPTGHQLGVCPAHYRRLRNTIETIARDYAILATMLEPGSTGYSDEIRISARVDPPAPARLDALVLRDPRTRPAGHQQPIPAIIRGYADRVAYERNLSRERTFSGQVGILLTHTAWITSRPWIVDLSTDLENCASALAYDLGDTPRSQAFAACPLIVRGTVCDGRIRAMTYSLGVACDRCGAQWIGDAELSRLRDILDDETDRQKR